MKIYTAADNYEDAARAWAKHIDKPFSVTSYEVSLNVELMQAIWRDIFPEVYEYIESDPHNFAERVAVYRLAAATQPEID